MANCLTYLPSLPAIALDYESSLPMNPQKLLLKALQNPNGLRFEELCALAKAFGFTYARTSGSHHIYIHPVVPELVNLQDVAGNAKAYQVRQLLRLAERYNLSIGGGS